MLEMMISGQSEIKVLRSFCDKAMDFVEAIVKSLEVRMSHLSKAWAIYFQKHKDLFGVAEGDPKEALASLK